MTQEERAGAVIGQIVTCALIALGGWLWGC